MGDLITFDRISFKGFNDDLHECEMLYGRGREPAPAKFQCARDFMPRLENWLTVMAAWAPPQWGLLRSLTSAGSYVQKPGKHGEGRAIDVDTVTWESFSISPFGRQHASPDVVVRRRYLALDAMCRTAFSWVLDGWFNDEHGDHIHCDDSSELILTTTARSTVAFCQAACNDVYGANLAVDGQWGPMTRAAVDDALRRSRIDGDPTVDRDTWQAWLRVISQVAFTGEAHR